jgi:hypothetical protein
MPDGPPPASSPLPPTTPSAPRAMASGEPARNGKPDAGLRERERDREREREWVPRESAQQHQHHREREPVAVAGTAAAYPRDMPPVGSNAAAGLNTPPLGESGSGSFLSRIGGPYRSPPTASNSFRSDIGEQRSWPEDDWDGARKRTLSGGYPELPFFFFFMALNHT